MRSSVTDRSSFFLFGGIERGSTPGGEYVLRAGERIRATQSKLANSFDWSFFLRRTLDSRLAAALSRPITAEESQFFADLEGLAALVVCALPAILSNPCQTPPLRIWSAGCGTGQGTYSLAITLAELCSGLPGRNLQLVATDEDAAVLRRAQRGIYTPSEVQRGMPIEWLIRHFEPTRSGGGWRFKSPLAERITWLQVGLSQSCAPVGVADIVMCHQDLGGDVETRRKQFGRLTGQLVAGGFLILPHPEPILEHDPELDRLSAGAAGVYRRLPRHASRLIA